jgi:uncharacterized protein (DUF1697 family)
LRGINVGNAKRVAMADLRDLVQQLGYTHVRTLLNSGNVVFAMPAKSEGDPAARIERALRERTGVDARVTVLSAKDWNSLIEKNPLHAAESEPSRFLVHLLRDPADRKLVAELAKQDWSPDALAVGPRAIYVQCAKGILDSKLVVAVQRALGDRVTARNWATVLKLKALAAATPAK